MSLILTRSRQANVTGTQITDIVLSGTTKTVDTLTAAEIRSVKWLITITDTTNNKTNTSEVLALHLTTGARHNRYAVMGDNISYSINVLLVGPDLTLEITNTEIIDLTINITRFETFV